MAAQLKLIQSTPAIPAILFSRELHLENRALRSIFAKFMTNFHNRVERLIAAAQDEGVLRTDIASADAAYLIISLVQGLAVRWSVSGRNFDLADEGNRLLELQLSGFADMRASMNTKKKTS